MNLHKINFSHFSQQLIRVRFGREKELSVCPYLKLRRGVSPYSPLDPLPTRVLVKTGVGPESSFNPQN